MAEEEKQEAEIQQELAKPEDVTAYIEDRQEQEVADRPPEDDSASEIAKLTDELREKHGLEDKKKASRHERRKKAHELLKREAEELRAKLGERGDESSKSPPQEVAPIDPGALENSLKISHAAQPEKFEAAYTSFLEYMQQTSDAATYQRITQDPDPGKAMVEWYEQGGHLQGAVEQGRNEEEFSRQLAERDRQIAQSVRLQMQVQEAARQIPDFMETVETVKDWGVNPGPVFTDLLMQHPQAMQMAYALAKDIQKTSPPGFADP